VRLSVAESLAHFRSRIISTISPPDFGITVAEPEIQDLAAASASMASSLPSRRRVDLSGRLTATTGKPASISSQQSAAPKEPVPSLANRGGVAELLGPADQFVIPLMPPAHWPAAKATATWTTL